LSRGSVGSKRYFGFSNGAYKELEAKEDKEQATLKASQLCYLPQGWRDVVGYGRWIEYTCVETRKGFKMGVLTIPHFENEGAMFTIINKAMTHFKEQDVRSIIIDLRGNDGGMDNEPPELLGFFLSENEKLLVENVAVTEASAEVMSANGENLKDISHPEGHALWVNSSYMKPGGEVHPSYALPHRDVCRWLGPTTVLVNRRTLSNGDMVAMGLQSIGTTTNINLNLDPNPYPNPYPNPNPSPNPSPDPAWSP